MSYEDDVRRGDSAHRLLNDPLLSEALKGIKDEIYAKWAATSPADKDGREHYWRLHEAASTFERCLLSYIASGEAALKQLEAKRKFALFK